MSTHPLYTKRAGCLPETRANSTFACRERGMVPGKRTEHLQPHSPMRRQRQLEESPALPPWCPPSPSITRAPAGTHCNRRTRPAPLGTGPRTTQTQPYPQGAYNCARIKQPEDRIITLPVRVRGEAGREGWHAPLAGPASPTSEPHTLSPAYTVSASSAYHLSEPLLTTFL